MKSKHTLGPWRIYRNTRLPDGTESESITAGDSAFERFICHCEGDDKGENANLIAAAPDLLAACKEVLENPYTTCACAEVLRAAVAKAQGK